AQAAGAASAAVNAKVSSRQRAPFDDRIVNPPACWCRRPRRCFTVAERPARTSAREHADDAGGDTRRRSREVAVARVLGDAVRPESVDELVDPNGGIAGEA